MTIKIILIITIITGVFLITGCKGKKEDDISEPPLNMEKITPTNVGALFEIKINGDDIESSNDIIVTKDGGYMIAGYTYSRGKGKGDACLVKCSAAGELEWNKTYGGPADDGSNWDDLIVQTADGGFAYAGWTQNYGAGGQDFWLVRTDVNGEAEWNATFGGTADDWANSMIQMT